MEILRQPQRAGTGRMNFLFTMSNSAQTNDPLIARLQTFFIRTKTTRARHDGGARRDRTDDLMLAKHALSQLSYGPDRSHQIKKIWWAWEDLNFRPHAYQARALTN